MNFTNKLIADKQTDAKIKNHIHSSKSKARGSAPAPSNGINPGRLVFLKDDGTKFKPRDPYLVIEVKGQNLILQKMASTGLLSSQQYSVPRNLVFPCLIQ